MGRIKTLAKKVAEKGANRVAALSTLSPSQLQDIVEKRKTYLEFDRPDDPAGIEKSDRLLAASGIKIYNAHLSQLSELYLPAEQFTAEEEKLNNPAHNIRYINITKWVSDKKENSLEKLVNVYGVLSSEDCNIALVFNRTVSGCNVILAVSNSSSKTDNKDINSYMNRLDQALKGNFPGSEHGKTQSGILPIFRDNAAYSVSAISNIPTEKSEKFISQTIEKLLDGTIPDTISQEYSLILLASPIHDIDERKLFLSELYSGLMPYSSWQTNYTFTESDGTSSMAMFGVNAGMSAGIQNTVSSSTANTSGETLSTGKTTGSNTAQSESTNVGQTDTQSISDTTSNSQTSTSGVNSSSSSSSSSGTSSSTSTSVGTSEAYGESSSFSSGGGASFIANVNASTTQANTYSSSLSKSLQQATATMQQTTSGTTTGTSSSTSLGKTVASQVGSSIAKTAGSSVGKTIGQSISNTLGRAVNTALSVTEGVAKGTSLGGNFGANFARASTITVTVGKNEGITQSYVNYNIKHAMEMIEEQMKRLDQSSALGMWDFAAYVISEDPDVSNNIAHTYLSLTQGEESHLSKASINTWRGNLAEEHDEVGESGSAKEIVGYLKNLRHPIFFLNPNITELSEHYYCYPPIATATTGLTGKELSYSLNFPQRSISGLPIIECAEFGRNVVSYDQSAKGDSIKLGKIFHMNHVEKADVDIHKDCLSSHLFVTGNTGSGKSNTIYHIIDNARELGVNFLVVEPAKGEYKNVFGNDPDVSVYGTNPTLSALLRINPFSFPDGIHILEHLDRLVEIFNVCWPMYAAMPAILKSAIELSYRDCGWNLVSSKNKHKEALYPCFADVARNIKTIIESSEYDNDNKGAYKGSLLTRLQSLTTGINGLLFSSDEINGNDLFEKNVIVDLSRVGSTETKSLIMGMLVLKLQEFRMTQKLGMNNSLRHVTVLEEAHNILRRTSIEQHSEGSNILGKSVEMLANAIAEMRTYGEGFIIADQAPGLMDMSVIRNTNTKIIMRLPDQTDRELVGKAANLDDDQIVELAKLPCGVGAVYQNEWVQPVLCKIEYYSPGKSDYSFDPDKNSYLFTNDSELSSTLLKCIMDNELFRLGDKEDLRELKSIVIRSCLDTTVKVDLINYIEAEREDGLNKLRELLFDLLNAEEAIELSVQYDDIHDWVNSVVEKLDPSIKDYSKKQIDLAMMLILQEQMIRDYTYKPLLNSFIELYRKGGGVF